MQIGKADKIKALLPGKGDGFGGKFLRQRDVHGAMKNYASQWTEKQNGCGWTVSSSTGSDQSDEHTGMLSRATLELPVVVVVLSAVPPLSRDA